MKIIAAKLPLCVLLAGLLLNSACSTTARQRVLYHLNPVNYKDPIINNTIKDPVFLALTAVTALSFIDKHETADWFEDHHPITGTNSETPGDVIGVVLPVASVVSLTLPQYLATRDRPGENQTPSNLRMVTEGAEVAGETFLWDIGLTEGLKAVVREERPEEDDDDNPGHDSFPSEHTSTAFAGATLMDRALKSEIEINGWDSRWRYLSIVPYAAAAFTGASRVESGQHFLPDVFAGAALGRAVAGTIYDLHYEVPKEGTPMEKRENMLRIEGRVIPMVSTDFIGIRYSGRF